MNLVHLCNRITRYSIHSGYVASLLPRWRSFSRACANPEAEQAQILDSIVSRNRDTEYGRRHRFTEITSPRKFQELLPIVDYDALEPFLLRMAAGESDVLTHDRVRFFELSGGSSSANKLIPFTEPLLGEIARSTHAWIFDIYRNFPALLGSRSYWAISPAVRETRHTKGGIPIGIEDDTEYFGPLARWALTRLMAAPASLASLASFDEWRVQTLKYLLESRDLGLVSVWHPSFLVLLLEYLEAHPDVVLARVEPRRRTELSAAFTQSGKFSPHIAWPHLNFLSCWTEGSATPFLPRLDRWFPNCTRQGKGLLATEGVVTIPVTGVTGGCPIAVNGHFLEFIDLEHPDRTPKLTHELQTGGRYSPILTTSGGLYRYHLKDEVICTGRYHNTPTLRFVGKLDTISDLRGEKITPAQVDVALERARLELKTEFTFAMLAPGQGDPPGYILFVETDLPSEALLRLADIIDTTLSEGHHYAYCRRIGQLAKVTTHRVTQGLATWQAALSEQGFRAGSLKPLSLDLRSNWEHLFPHR